MCFGSNSIYPLSYIDNICSLDIDGLIVKYADNTCLLFSRAYWNEVYLKAAKELNKVIEFINYRKLLINYNKTMFMNFMINNKEELFNDLMIHFCDGNNLCNGKLCKTLCRVSSICYLGLTIDHK